MCEIIFLRGVIDNGEDRWNVWQGRNRGETNQPLFLALSQKPAPSKFVISYYYTILDTFITEGSFLFVIIND